MKKSSKKTFIFTVLILCAALIAGGVFVFFGSEKKPVKINEITEFETVTLRQSGMRVTEEFEIICKGEKSEVSYYQINYNSGEAKRELQKSAVCDTAEVISKLNETGVGRWNGFHGKHPRGVLDGTMFNFTTTVNGGEKIHADGSQNFPKNYRVLTDWLYEKLK